MAYTHDNNDLTPVMTANNAPSPIVVSAYSESSSYLAWRAFNHTTGDYIPWVSTAAPSIGTSQWLKIDFGENNQQYVGAYAIIDNNSIMPNTAPKDWTFQGSNDGNNWVILDTRSNEVSANWNQVLRYFQCQKAGLYRYYRIDITANSGSTAYVAIAELELFDTRVNLCQTMTSNTAPSPFQAFASSEYSSSYANWNSFDKNITTKWCSGSSSSHPHWLSYYFGGDKYIFTGIAIQSGDVVSAMPSAFSIQASNDNVTWDDISQTYSGITGWVENISKNFTCTCNKAYRYIRLYLISNIDSGQYGNVRELKVFGYLKDKCLTPPMTSNTAPSPYVASGTYNYTSYEHYKAFNRIYSQSETDMAIGLASGVGSYYKQIYFGGQLCKITHVDMQGTLTAESYITSPKDFTISGSIDDITYTTIGTFAGITWNRYEYKTFPVTVGYWKYLRVSVTASNSSASFCGIGEILPYGTDQLLNLCATMTSNSLPAPYSCSASSENDGYLAWKAFNKSNTSDTDCWSTNGVVANTWLQYYFGGISYYFKAIVMQGYYSGYATGTPTDFIVQGSNDGTNFTNIKSFSGISWTSGDKKIFELNSSIPYKYIRLYISANGGWSNAIVGELEVYGYPVKQIVNTYPDITPAMTANAVPENYLTAASSSNSSNYYPYKSFDNIATNSNVSPYEWFASGTTVPAWISFKLPYSYAFNRIDFYAWSDYFTDNPQSFEIQGSQNNDYYVPIAKYEGVVWAAGELKTFRFKNEQSFQYMRIYILNTIAIRTSAGTYPKIGEIYVSREERDNGFDI